MNENQKRSLILTTSLILVIILMIYFNMMVFISGPHIYDDSVNELEIAVKNTIDAESVELINKYTLEEEVYVFKAQQSDMELLVFYADNVIHEQLDSSTYDEEKLDDYISMNYYGDYNKFIGYYADKPIIALVNDTEEVIIDYFTYEEIFIWNKGE